MRNSEIKRNKNVTTAIFFVKISAEYVFIKPKRRKIWHEEESQEREPTKL